MPQKVRLPEIITETFLEANKDGHAVAQQIGLPPGWWASATQRPAQEAWDMKFIAPTGEKLRSIVQICSALGAEHNVPEFLRSFCKPTLPPLTDEEKEKYHSFFYTGKVPSATLPAPTPAPAKRPAPEIAADVMPPVQAARKTAEPEDPAIEEAELAKLETTGARDQAEGFAILRREAREGSSEAFMVLPDDVESITDLDMLAAKIVASGWRAESHAAASRSRRFTGKWDLSLHAESGRLLVRCQDRGVVDRIARLYTDTWLLA